MGWEGAGTAKQFAQITDCFQIWSPRLSKAGSPQGWTERPAAAREQGLGTSRRTVWGIERTHMGACSAKRLGAGGEHQPRVISCHPLQGTMDQCK